MADLKQKLLLFIWVIALVISSCRTARDVSVSRLKPLSAERLMHLANQNAYDFDDLTIKRINVQYQDNVTKTSFRANLKASKDEKILASVSKLNLPVGRVMLTPENVTFVNYIDKNYYDGDYSFLSSLLHFDVNFDLVQAVLTNPLKTDMIQSPAGYEHLESSVEDGRYVLQHKSYSGRSYNGKKPFPIRKNRVEKLLKEENMVIRKMILNPAGFVIEKLIMADNSDDRILEVDFSDFVKVEEYDYPGVIDVKVFSGDEKAELNIRLRGFSTENVDSLKLSIPSSYQPVYRR